MIYEPFKRGPHPVGVKTHTWTDPVYDRQFEVEVWYPATPLYAGMDLSSDHWDYFDPASVDHSDESARATFHQEAVRGAEPISHRTRLILLIHGWAGFRRESTFMGVHLASHGYTVVAPDVIGSRYADVAELLHARGRGASESTLYEHLVDVAAIRRTYINALIDLSIEKLNIHGDSIGVTGASFGGWSAIIAPSIDPRVTAIVPLCPGNNDAPIHHATEPIMVDQIDLDWKYPAAALQIVADRDSLVPLYGQLALHERLPTQTKQLVILADADHNHFVDDVEGGQAGLATFAREIHAAFPRSPARWDIVAEGVPPIANLVDGELAKVALRGLSLAHFDQYLRDYNPACAVLEDPTAALGSLGVKAYTFRSPAR